MHSFLIAVYLYVVLLCLAFAISVVYGLVYALRYGVAPLLVTLKLDPNRVAPPALPRAIASFHPGELR